MHRATLWVTLNTSGRSHTHVPRTSHMRCLSMLALHLGSLHTAHTICIASLLRDKRTLWTRFVIICHSDPPNGESSRVHVHSVFWFLRRTCMYLAGHWTQGLFFAVSLHADGFQQGTRNKTTKATFCTPTYFDGKDGQPTVLVLHLTCVTLCRSFPTHLSTTPYHACRRYCIVRRRRTRNSGIVHLLFFCASHDECTVKIGISVAY